MYIDAVQRTMGPSSYCSVTENIVIDIDWRSDSSVSSLANQIQTFQNFSSLPMFPTALKAIGV